MMLLYFITRVIEHTRRWDQALKISRGKYKIVSKESKENKTCIYVDNRFHSFPRVGSWKYDICAGVRRLGAAHL